MELPVAPQTYSPSTDALIRAVKRADRILARMAAEEAECDGFTVFTNPSRPQVHMANYACEVRIPDGLSPAQLLDRIEAHFAALSCRCHRLVGNDIIWPDDSANSIEARGFTPIKRQVYLLTHYAAPAQLNEKLQIIPARAAYVQLRALYKTSALSQYDMADDDADHLADTHIDHLDEPRSESFLGRLDGKPVGAVNLVTLGQIGVIENLFTDKAVRNQGVASTLLAHAIDHCQRALFEQVILETDQNNVAAQRLYERFGFKPAAEYHYYQRID